MHRKCITDNSDNAMNFIKSGSRIWLIEVQVAEDPLYYDYPHFHKNTTITPLDIKDIHHVVNFATDPKQNIRKQLMLITLE